MVPWMIVLGHTRLHPIRLVFVCCNSAADALAPVRLSMPKDYTRSWQPWRIMPADPSLLMKPCIPFWVGQFRMHCPMC